MADDTEFVRDVFLVQRERIVSTLVEARPSFPVMHREERVLLAAGLVGEDVGDDAAAKSQVTAILKDFGWPGAIDIGGIEGARWLEALVPLWVAVGMKIGRWDHAFKVVHG